MRYTQKELEADIKSKLENCYFKKPLPGEIYSIGKRRSFDALKEAYKVTDRKLMKALINLEMGCYYCPDIKKIVFHRVNRYLSRKAILGDSLSTTLREARIDVIINKYSSKKYTPDYLASLIEDILNTKL